MAHHSWIARASKLAPVLWVAVALLAAYVLSTRLDEIALPQVWAALKAIPTGPLAIASISCLIAYLILSGYEIIAVYEASGRWLVRTSIVTSWIAHSIGHVIGAALVSGGALRYRRYSKSGLRAGTVGAITALSAMPYVLAAFWWLDIMLLFHPEVAASALRLPPSVILVAAIIGIAKDVAWLMLVSWKRSLSIGSWNVSLPSLRMTLIQTVVGAAEILLVAAVLYVLIAEHLDMNLVAFTGLFLIAAAAAQVSHVPAGLGVLEAALLLLLPQVPPDELLAAILAFRAIFELFPLAIGLALLVHEELRDRRHVARAFGKALPPTSE